MKKPVLLTFLMSMAGLLAIKATADNSITLINNQPVTIELWVNGIPVQLAPNSGYFKPCIEGEKVNLQLLEEQEKTLICGTNEELNQ